jgi:hypothetical protein
MKKSMENRHLCNLISLETTHTPPLPQLNVRCLKKVEHRFSTEGRKRHLGCEHGSEQNDHLRRQRLILITLARAEKGLSIKASRTHNSQITLKGPPLAFLSVSIHNKCHLCLCITIENSRISYYRKVLL